MLRKKQVVTMVSVAVVSFLVGTTFSVMTMATDGGNPWDRVWEAIYELQGRVGELEKKPNVLSVTAYPDETLLQRGMWTDLLYVSNVEVPEGANALTISSGYFYCMEVTQCPLELRYRANNTYGESIRQGFTGDIWVYGTARETITTHHTWTNLTAGTYTFAIQYFVGVTRDVYVANSTLTVVIF